MKTHTKDYSIEKMSRLAGFMFLFAFIVPMLNWALILSRINVEDGVLETATNIMANMLLFRLGIAIELFMTIGLVVLAFALYRILKTVNRDLALLALLLKLVEACIAAIIVLISFIALEFADNEALLTMLSPDQRQLPVGFMLNAHTAIFSIPMVFLGIDMIMFTYLFYRSNYIPKLLAGFGVLSFILILIHALMYILVPEIAVISINKFIFWAPSGLFEIIIGIWLLTRGINKN